MRKEHMSKYEPLWKYVSVNRPETLCFDEIKEICGFPIDHAFLKLKKDLCAYGWEVKKISMKNQIVYFDQIPQKKI